MDTHKPTDSERIDLIQKKPISSSSSSSTSTQVSSVNQASPKSQVARNRVKSANSIEIDPGDTLDPCTKISCHQYGMECSIDSSTHEASCFCPINICPSYKSPVCGSDGITYESECHFIKNKCLLLHSYLYGSVTDITQQEQSLQLTLASSSEVDSNPDLILEADEKFNQINQLTAVPFVFDPGNVKTNIAAIGTNLKNTQSIDGNIIKIATSSTVSPFNLTIVSRGTCPSDACNNVTCPFSGICRSQSVKELITCQCPDCPEVHSPVCGSDGTTYVNECFVRKQSCKNQVNITVRHDGYCKGCQEITCPHYSRCHFDVRTNQAECLCPEDECSKRLAHNSTWSQDMIAEYYDRVICATDGQTYLSLCQMERVSCQQKVTTKVAYAGPCDPCKDVKCNFGASCKDGQCVCPTDCPDLIEPVCVKSALVNGNNNEDEQLTINHNKVPASAAVASVDSSVPRDKLTQSPRRSYNYQSECEMRSSACKDEIQLDFDSLIYGTCTEEVHSFDQSNSAIISNSNPVEKVVDLSGDKLRESDRNKVKQNEDTSFTRVTQVNVANSNSYNSGVSMSTSKRKGNGKVNRYNENKLQVNSHGNSKKVNQNTKYIDERVEDDGHITRVDETTDEENTDVDDDAVGEDDTNDENDSDEEAIDERPLVLDRDDDDTEDDDEETSDSGGINYGRKSHPPKVDSSKSYHRENNFNHDVDRLQSNIKSGTTHPSQSKVSHASKTTGKDSRKKSTRPIKPPAFSFSPSPMAPTVSTNASARPVRPLDEEDDDADDASISPDDADDDDDEDDFEDNERDDDDNVTGNNEGKGRINFSFKDNRIADGVDLTDEKWRVFHEAECRKLDCPIGSLCQLKSKKLTTTTSSSSSVAKKVDIKSVFAYCDCNIMCQRVSELNLETPEWKITGPVCASNGISYPNECEFHRANCLIKYSHRKLASKALLTVVTNGKFCTVNANSSVTSARSGVDSDGGISGRQNIVASSKSKDNKSDSSFNRGGGGSGGRRSQTPVDSDARGGDDDDDEDIHDGVNEDNLDDDDDVDDEDNGIDVDDEDRRGTLTTVDVVQSTGMTVSSSNLPSSCQCNKYGSVNPDCSDVGYKYRRPYPPYHGNINLTTFQGTSISPSHLSSGTPATTLPSQCICRPGVGGKHCDRCNPDYWGLHKILSHSVPGCLPCDCNVNGSVRSDCEQMTGRCVCKPGVLGVKCDECPSGRILTVYGCTDESIFRSLPKSCSQMVCLFGARCREIKDTRSRGMSGGNSSSVSGGVNNWSSDHSHSSTSSLQSGVSSSVNASEYIVTTRAQCICDGLCEMPPPDASYLKAFSPSHPSHSQLSSSLRATSNQLKSPLTVDQSTPTQFTIDSNDTAVHQWTETSSFLLRSLPPPLYNWLHKHMVREKRQVTPEVCGSNGITYASECELRMHSCRIQESINILSKGPCKSRS